MMPAILMPLICLMGPLLGATQQADQPGFLRGPVRIMATRTDGEPWSAATVVLLTRPVANDGELEGEDLVRVRTDARGIARARIWPGRPYSCWAQGVEADGEGGVQAGVLRKYRCSQILEDVRAGDILRLKAEARLQTRYRIEIRGLDRWKAKAPFTLRVASTGPVRLFLEAVALGDDGTFDMPLMPGPMTFVQIFGKGMYPIHQEPVPIDPASWKLARAARLALEQDHDLEGIDPGPLADRYAVRVPPPAMARVEVKDSAGKGVAGARLFFDPNQARAPWYPVSTTDAQGHGAFEIPAWRRKDGTAFAEHLDVLVRADEIADSWGTREGFSFAKDGSTPPMKIDCAVGYTGRGSLHLKEGLALGNQELILFSSVQRGKSGGQVGIGPYRFRTDRKGRFRLPGRARNYRYRLCTLLTPVQIRSLGFDRKYPTASLVVLANQQGSDQTPLELRMDEFIALELQLVGRDGSPDGDARLHVEQVDPGSTGPHYPLAFRPDRRGRLRILCRPGFSYLVYATGTRGARLEQIDVSKQVPGKVLQKRIAIDRGIPIRGQVVDARGQPIAKALVTLNSLGAGKCSSRFPFLTNWTVMAMLAWSTEKRLRSGIRQHPNWIWRARQWRFFSHPQSQGISNDEGRFALWLPEGYRSATVRAACWKDNRWQDSQPVPCQMTADPTQELHLVIEK